jgi:thioredoxin 1
MAVELVTDSDFESKLKENDKVVVKYFADWCGSCRLFAPKYKRLAADERFEKVIFLDVNAENSPEARKKAGVTTLPYFAIFKNGALVEAISSSKEEAVVDLILKLN